MLKSKYKLIATDMDGTLLNKNVEIAPNNIEYIKKAQENGLIFVLASGRPTFAMREAENILEMQKFSGYIISYNGGEIIECKTNKSIFKQGIDKEDVISMYNYAMENNLSFITYVDDTIYMNEYNEYTSVEVKFTKAKYEIIEDINSLDFSKIIKCMLLSDENKLIEEEKKLNSSSYAKKLFFARSLPIFLEVVNKDVDKGKTLNKLAKILKLEKEEIIGVGDSYNDIPLLVNSGLKVSPNNAKKEIKELSDYVGCSNEDGIIKDVIEKYIFI